MNAIFMNHRLLPMKEKCMQLLASFASYPTHLRNGSYNLTLFYRSAYVWLPKQYSILTYIQFNPKICSIISLNLMQIH